MLPRGTHALAQAAGCPSEVSSASRSCEEEDENGRRRTRVGGGRREWDEEDERWKGGGQDDEERSRRSGGGEKEEEEGEEGAWGAEALLHEAGDGHSGDGSRAVLLLMLLR